MRSCFLVFLVNIFPFSNSRARSSVTFIFFSCSWLYCCCGGVCVIVSCGVVDIWTTFFAASCFPPSNQNDSFLFIYFRFSRSQSPSPSCRFSTSSRFFAASQRLIFLWKYLRKSSFFFSTSRKIIRDLTQQDGRRERTAKIRRVTRVTTWFVSSLTHFRFVTAVLLTFTTWKQGEWGCEENVSIFILLSLSKLSFFSGRT